MAESNSTPELRPCIKCGASDTSAAKERERQSDKIRAHIGRCTMSVYGTQAECKAARDALERLLDDES